MPAEAAELFALVAAAFAFSLAFAPASMPRRKVALEGGTGIVGGAAIALAPTLDLAVLVLLTLGTVEAAMGGGAAFALRARARLAAAGVLALALVFLSVEGPELLARYAAVGLVAGLAAAIGLFPFLQPAGEDDTSSSPTFWLVLVGPLLAIGLVARAQALLPVDAGEAYAAILIGVGLLNMLWGGLASWFTARNEDAWRYSFLADWGLVLCAFGLTLIDGRRAALLVLFGIIACRFPLYVIARERAGRRSTAAEGPLNLLVAATLAGSAPFVGFAARVLLLRGATQLFWPLALTLGLAMLLWLPGSLRLGRSMGVPRGRRALAVAIVLAVNVAAGLYPLPLLVVAGI